MDSRSSPPETLPATRDALHRLAAYVIAPVRYVATGRFGLRATTGGFGTPPFDGRQIRVEGVDLVDDGDGEIRREPITSLSAAAAFLRSEIDPETAAEHDSPAVGDVDAHLKIDPAAAAVLAEWFGVAFAALGAVRADAASVDASETQLWPGHFDAAIEVGDENHRASYGASPGDDGIAEPYLYVSVWWPDRIGIDTTDAFWNAPNFVGSMLRRSEFPEDVHPVETAMAFWRRSRDTLG